VSQIVPRTVTVVGDSRGRSAPLANFQSAPAYVLLGDPGAGKTAAFRAESAEHDDGEFITARRFLRRGVDRLSEWERRTLFIDGLDAVRVGSSDPNPQSLRMLVKATRDGEWPEDRKGTLARAVKSNLFEGRGDGRFAPVHHQVSEILAARFLHDRIDSGLPAWRVLALMSDDGVAVTKLRGLAGWLAAFDLASRWAIVETDPVGVALYGDISGFWVRPSARQDHGRRPGHSSEVPRPRRPSRVSVA